MISILNYTEYHHGGVCFILVAESVPCPICGGKLLHGTCRRKCVTTNGIVTLGLRVLECRKCHHTHRELPCGVVPYKRHCAEIMVERQGETCPDSVGEFSAFLRLKAWLKWFLKYAEKVMTGLATAYDDLFVSGNLRFILNNP